MSGTNHNTISVYTHIGQPRSTCRLGALFGVVQEMDHHLNPTITLVSFGICSPIAAASDASTKLFTRARDPIGMEIAELS